jgi:hypothetical protein
MDPNYPGYKPKKKIEKNSRGITIIIKFRLWTKTNRKDDIREWQFRNGCRASRRRGP